MDPTHLHEWDPLIGLYSTKLLIGNFGKLYVSQQIFYMALRTGSDLTSWESIFTKAGITMASAKVYVSQQIFYKPSMWFRYVDDLFVLRPHQKDVQTLLNHVKSIRPSILPFLDVLVARTEQGFRSSVYRKPTFTGQYLNFNSYHPYNVKKGTVRCLQHRVTDISCDTDADQE